jgi:hypothetical protein
VTVPVVEQEVPLPETAVAALVESEGSAQDAVSDRLIEILLTLWASFEAFYAGDAVAEFAQRAAQYVLEAQRVAAGITEAHLRLQIQRMDEQLARSLPGQSIADVLETGLRFGATPDEVYTRPVRQVRYLESVEKVPRETAVETARERLEKAALADLQLARTVSAQQVLQRFPQATGWRRIIHPELGNVCGLCIAAADRVYQVVNRMDIHPGCKCTVLPIVGGLDPGGSLNAADLKRLYAAAGSTGSRALAAVRVQTLEHGEMGAILTPEGAEIKDAALTRRQSSPEALERKREQLQRQFDELQRKGRRSEWHASRLQQIEDLLAAA